MNHLTPLLHLSQSMQHCIQNCRDCQDICLATVPHCLGMGGEHTSPGHITTLLTCARMCDTSADFMVVSSPLHAHVCGVCAEVCTQCATECERMAEGDEQMLACAEVCYRCADSCNEMAKMAA